MSNKNFELRFIDRENLAEQGILVPQAQPFSFLNGSMPKVGDEMRNGLDVKAERGSPVFTVKAINDEDRDGASVTIVELQFNRTEPTPYSKVPQNH